MRMRIPIAPAVMLAVCLSGCTYFKPAITAETVRQPPPPKQAAPPVQQQKLARAVEALKYGDPDIAVKLLDEVCAEKGIPGITDEALFRLTYYDLASGTTASRDVRVPGRKTIEYTNVLEQLFGVGAGVKSQGPLFVESDPNGLFWCRVASSLTSGTIGDSFPVVPIPSEGLTGGGAARVVSIDGLEQSVDRTRGTRSNLILNEVAGEPVTVVVSLWEAGNRSSPIAEREVSLAALEKVQLSTVFSELGLDSDERRKDRTNVLCTVRAKAGGGLASAVVTSIDNRTGDTRNIALAPNGSGAVGVTIGF